MFQVNGIIFDLDGTLVNSKHDYGEMSRRVKQVLLDVGVESSLLEEQGKAWQVMRGGPGFLDGLGVSDSLEELISQKVIENINVLITLINGGEVVLRKIPLEAIKYVERQVKGIKSSIKVKRANEEAVDLTSYLK